MGYEIRLHVVSNSTFGKDPTMLQVGMIDLCKAGLRFDKTKGIRCNLYASFMTDSAMNCKHEHDGHCSSDCYGDDIFAYPIEYVIMLIEEKQKIEPESYWRFTVALDFLRSIKKNWSWHGKPFVAVYGY